MNNIRTLTDAERQQLQAAEDRVAFLKKRAAEAAAFCRSSALRSVDWAARLDMNASIFTADKAEAELFELRRKLGV